MSKELNERIARALALEYYRGQYKVKTDDPRWLKDYVPGIEVGTVLAAQYGEEEAQKMAKMFWSYWSKDAEEVLSE